MSIAILCNVKHASKQQTIFPERVVEGAISGRITVICGGYSQGFDLSLDQYSYALENTRPLPSGLLQLDFTPKGLAEIKAAYQNSQTARQTFRLPYVPLYKYGPVRRSP